MSSAPQTPDASEDEPKTGLTKAEVNRVIRASILDELPEGVTPPPAEPSETGANITLLVPAIEPGLLPELTEKTVRSYRPSLQVCAPAEEALTLRVTFEIRGEGEVVGTSILERA